MNGTTDELIQQAFEAGKAGDKESAKKLLSQVVKQDPQNARAWYLLSQVVDKDEQATYCLEKALEANPDNIRVAQRLQQIRTERDGPPEAKKLQQRPPKEKKKPNLVLIGIASVAVLCILCVVGSLVLNALGLLGSSTSISTLFVPLFDLCSSSVFHSLPSFLDFTSISSSPLDTP